jgi:plasmid stabilization system protein ParE
MHALLKHPLVDCDLEEAALWYDQRDPSVAVRLIEESKRAMHAAADNPFLFPIRFADVRRIKLTRFPHSIYFTADESSVYILALIHGSREIRNLIEGRKYSASD